MKTTNDNPGFTTVVLSRRNLLTLLAKLDGFPPDSECSIVGGYEAPNIWLRAEEDEVHYAHRQAGEMHPITEVRISEGMTSDV